MSWTDTLKTKLKLWDHQLDRCLPLSFLLIILLVVLLRLPNFFEPYWYGDEAIYLTVGNGLNQGKVLYRDIMDHKTPIIYYLARTPNQLWFRVLLFGWSLMLVSTFYLFAKKLISRNWLVNLATLTLALLTTLPWLEGNIPNGELFVLGFVMVGFWVLTKTSLLDYAFKSTRSPVMQVKSTFWHSLKLSFRQTKKEHWLLTLAGFMFGLGLMTKVPALFDFAGALSLILVGYLARIKLNKPKTWIRHLPTALMYSIILMVGFSLPIIISLVYFYVKEALPDYIQYGLLYNFHYASTWHHDFGSNLANFLFTLKGKIGLLLVLLGLVIGFNQKLDRKIGFALLWFGLALVASLLSNRPYPHYFIQLVAPLSLLVGLVLDLGLSNNQNKAKKGVSLVLSLGLISVAGWMISLLQVRPYSSLNYYRHFFQLANQTTNYTQYKNSFNSLVADNTQAARIIRSSQTPEIFIWGTNPMLYALSKTTPPTRFVVLFHIEDVNAYDEVRQDLTKRSPKYIVVMKDAQKPPAWFANLLNQAYLPNYQFEHLVLWRKIR